METITAIMTRRSIRTWKQEPVSAEARKVILEAAMNAPSAADARPWHFVTMDDPSVIGQFTEMGGTEMLAEAPLLIMVCGEIEKEIYPGFWPQDCSCAMQNMQLALHDIGLGAVWVAVYPLDARVEHCRSVLNIPGNITPFAILAVGAPNEELPAEARYDENLVHTNKW